MSSVIRGNFVHNLFLSKQGFKGDECIGDVVRAAMYSKSFPDIKSPEQMAFEVKVQNIVQNAEIDLDELSPVEFLTSDEESVDNENMIEILDEMDFLGDTENETKHAKREYDGGPNENPKRRKRESSKAEREENRNAELKEEINSMNEVERKGIAALLTSIKEIRRAAESSTVERKENRNAELKEEINSMNEAERKGIAAFFRSLKEMRRAAKLNLAALTRLKELTTKYPSLEFMYKILKPVSEIMPDNPINTITPILEIVGVKPTSGGNKYNTESVVKITPKQFLKGGKIYHRCSLAGCTFERVSWGAVNTHIVKDHIHKSYVCDFCEKVLSSMDGLRRHKQNHHKLDK